MESDIGITFVRGPGFDDETWNFVAGEIIAIDSRNCGYEEYVLKCAAVGAEPASPEELEETRLMGKLLDDFERRRDEGAV